MKYILIVIYVFGYGPRANIKFQEFESLEKCQKAQNIIAKDNQWANAPNIYCVEK